MSSQFLSLNYSASNLANALTASSEASGFPKENITDFERRTKVWRSGGYFEIDEGQNTIVFEETAASPLTATIPAGGYSSFSALATEIKTQMEAVGASTYTVSQDATTLKAVITSDGAGGGGILNLNWTTAGDVGTILGYDTSSDDTGALSYTADALRISTGEFFLYDFGVSLNPDAIVVSWRQDEVNDLNDTAVLRVRASYTNNFSSPVYEATTAKTDFGFLLTRDDNSTGLASNYCRYWRLDFTDIDNPNGFIELGSVFIGDFINFSRGQVQFPFNASWEDGSVSQISEGGQSIGNKRYITRTFTTQWFGLTQSEKEAFDDFYDRVRTVNPFYILLDPNTVIGSQPERFTAYVKFVAAPNWVLQRPGIFSLNCQLREDI